MPLENLKGKINDREANTSANIEFVKCVIEK